MQSNSEARIVRLETLVKWAQDRLRSIFNRLDALDNAVRQMSGMQYNWGGEGGGATVPCYCVAPADQTATSIDSPADFTADVMTLDGSPSTVATDATIYYHSTLTMTSGSVAIVLKNGDGSYSVTNIICMAGA